MWSVIRWCTRRSDLTLVTSQAMKVCHPVRMHIIFELISQEARKAILMHAHAGHLSRHEGQIWLLLYLHAYTPICVHCDTHFRRRPTSHKPTPSHLLPALSLHLLITCSSPSLFRLVVPAAGGAEQERMPLQIHRRLAAGCGHRGVPSPVSEPSHARRHDGRQP